jgi:hypothetical protein
MTHESLDFMNHLDKKKKLKRPLSQQNRGKHNRDTQKEKRSANHKQKDSATVKNRAINGNGEYPGRDQGHRNVQETKDFNRMNNKKVFLSQKEQIQMEGFEKLVASDDSLTASLLGLSCSSFNNDDTSFVYHTQTVRERPYHTQIVRESPQKTEMSQTFPESGRGQQVN